MIIEHIGAAQIEDKCVAEVVSTVYADDAIFAPLYRVRRFPCMTMHEVGHKALAQVDERGR